MATNKVVKHNALTYTNITKSKQSRKITTAAKQLKQWLSQLEALPKFIDASPAPTRVKIILERLNFKKNFTLITIAGTNGKGSTANLLAQYYQNLGLKVGLFTSPHLLKYNERIKINGSDANDTQIIHAFEQIKAVQQQDPLTYFDYSFIASLIIFQQENLELICLEAGLGGRLDAVNALDTDCAIITTIDFDHMQQLGHTIDAIGFEKAGIIRPHTPFICGDTKTIVSIKNQAQQQNAIYLQRGQDFEIINTENHWQLNYQNHLSTELTYPKHIALQNAATALASILALAQTGKTPSFNAKIFNHLLENLKPPGRMQILNENPLILADVAHNAQSAQYLAEQLMQKPSPGKTYAIFSAFKDKDLPALVKPMQALIDTWYLLELKNPRAASLEELKAALTLSDIKIITNLEQSYTHIKASLNSQDRLIIFGSFALVSEFITCHNKPN